MTAGTNADSSECLLTQLRRWGGSDGARATMCTAARRAVPTETPVRTAAAQPRLARTQSRWRGFLRCLLSVITDIRSRTWDFDYVPGPRRGVLSEPEGTEHGGKQEEAGTPSRDGARCAGRGQAQGGLGAHRRTGGSGPAPRPPRPESTGLALPCQLGAPSAGGAGEDEARSHAAGAGLVVDLRYLRAHGEKLVGKCLRGHRFPEGNVWKGPVRKAMNLEPGEEPRFTPPVGSGCFCCSILMPSVSFKDGLVHPVATCHQF